MFIIDKKLYNIVLKIRLNVFKILIEVFYELVLNIEYVSFLFRVVELVSYIDIR